MALAVVLSGCSFFGLLDVDGVIAQTSGLPYTIVDTGQVLTYNNAYALPVEPGDGDAFYGQDAQVDGNQPSYTINGDGTVTDLVTGLTWTQGYYGKMTYSKAVAMVDSFGLAGYSDWRLPSIKELYSLIDFSGEDVSPQAGSASNPFIDTATFDFAYGDTSAGERIIDSQWATTTLYTGSTGFAWGAQLMFGVNFADGRLHRLRPRARVHERPIHGRPRRRLPALRSEDRRGGADRQRPAGRCRACREPCPRRAQRGLIVRPRRALRQENRSVTALPEVSGRMCCPPPAQLLGF